MISVQMAAARTVAAQRPAAASPVARATALSPARALAVQVQRRRRHHLEQKPPGVERPAATENHRSSIQGAVQIHAIVRRVVPDHPLNLPTG